MPDSCTYVYIHYVWATWDRMPLVTPLVETEIYACLTAKCRELECVSLAIGGTEDHVHVLARLHPMVAVAQLAHGMKGSSSHLITHRLAYLPPFRWQGCYGAFSVSQSHVRRIVSYIEHQKDHHATKKCGHWQKNVRLSRMILKNLINVFSNSTHEGGFCLTDPGFNRGNL